MNNQPQLFYFTNSTCQVCHALLPKLTELIQQNFPQCDMRIVRLEEEPAFAADHRVYAAPTLIILVGNLEYRRFCGVFSIAEVEFQLNRIIDLSTRKGGFF